MITAIHDFGAGHSGLNMLAEFVPDVVNLDMALTRNIHPDRVRQAIVRSIMSLCGELHISVIAEGIETMQEAVAARDLGIRLFQGFLFARPAIERLPSVQLLIVEQVRSRHERDLLERSAAAG